LKNNIKCRLCGSGAELIFHFRGRNYYRCGSCCIVLMGEEFFLSEEEEKLRYEQHNNDINDPGYREFTLPVVRAVESDFGKESIGLDFGSGTGPVITAVLREKGYSVETYDKFFDSDKSKLLKKYDYAVCCEVIEHFKHPEREFELLRSLIKPGGKLYCMTEMYDDEILRDWYYMKDPTHTALYCKKTFEFMGCKYGFPETAFKGRLIVMGV